MPLYSHSLNESIQYPELETLVFDIIARIETAELIKLVLGNSRMRSDNDPEAIQ